MRELQTQQSMGQLQRKISAARKSSFPKDIRVLTVGDRPNGISLILILSILHFCIYPILSPCFLFQISLIMQFNPSDCLVFQYKPDQHLPTTLIIKNTSNIPLGFKFKVSTTNRFHINPSVGMLKPNTEAKVNVVIHREIVGKADEEKIQVLYGEKYQESRYFSLLVENGSKSDKLNLTMIVHQKEQEIKRIKKEISDYRSMPTNTLPAPKKGKSQVVLYAITAIVALVAGYFVPFQLFGR